MPLYEFKCLICHEFFELLIMNKDEEILLKCPKCNSEDFERVISATNFAIGDGSAGGQQRLSAQTRACSTGTCTTYDIPGHTR